MKAGSESAVLAQGGGEVIPQLWRARREKSPGCWSVDQSVGQGGDGSIIRVIAEGVKAIHSVD